MKYALGALFLLAACTPKHGPDEPRVGAGDLCDAAEVRLKALDCHDPGGNPMWVNLDGEPFGDTCRRVLNEGGVFLNPACVADANTCEEANQCPAQ